MENTILNKLDKIKTFKKFKKEFEILDKEVLRSDDRVKKYDIVLKCKIHNDKEHNTFYIDISNYLLVMGKKQTKFFKIDNKKLLDTIYLDIANEYEKTRYKLVFEKLDEINDILKKDNIKDINIDKVKQIYNKIIRIYEPPPYQPISILENDYYTELDKKFIEVCDSIEVINLLISMANKKKNKNRRC